MTISQEIVLRLDRLEADMKEHYLKDEKAFKYAHNMMENSLEKLASLERSVSHYEGGVVLRVEMEKDKKLAMDNLDLRLRVVEKLAWTAVGGLIVLGGLVSIIGKNILQLLAK